MDFSPFSTQGHGRGNYLESLKGRKVITRIYKKKKDRKLSFQSYNCKTIKLIEVKLMEQLEILSSVTDQRKEIDSKIDR